MNYDADVLNGLAEKLDSLELTDDERGALDAIMTRAADAEPEVTGFALPGNLAGGLTPGGFQLGGSLGLVPPSSSGIDGRPGGPLRP